MTTSLVLVKQSLITKLKAEATVTSLLKNGAIEVREAEWQGDNFGYPCVRVHVDKFVRHTPGADCLLFDAAATVYVLADNASSLMADQIATAIHTLLDTKSIHGTTIQTKLYGIKAEQYGASWIEEGGVWRSEVSLNFQTS